MAPIINTENNGQQIVLTRPFFAQRDRQEDRDLHAHNCVELSYVLSGTADHVLHAPGKEPTRQKLSRGNYMILDTDTYHAYKNCSADFSLMNLLFQKSFLSEAFADADVALYDLIKALFPDFPYDQLTGSPVDRVCFDRDGSVLALAQICHTTSRQHYHAWQDAVRHALKLMLMQALYGLEEYTRPKKENIIDNVKWYIEAHYAEELTLTDICAKCFYSLPYVSARFKEVCGCTFEQYLRQLRIQRAGELLLTTALSVSEVAERCGYTSPRAFRRAFIDVTGVPPTTFKKNYRI